MHQLSGIADTEPAVAAMACAGTRGAGIAAALNARGQRAFRSVGLAHGVPCVMTPIAAEGVAFPETPRWLIAQTPAQMAERVVTLHRDEALAAQLRRPASPLRGRASARPRCCASSPEPSARRPDLPAPRRSQMGWRSSAYWQPEGSGPLREHSTRRTASIRASSKGKVGTSQPPSSFSFQA